MALRTIKTICLEIDHEFVFEQHQIFSWAFGIQYFVY